MTLRLDATPTRSFVGLALIASDRAHGSRLLWASELLRARRSLGALARIALPPGAPARACLCAAGAVAGAEAGPNAASLSFVSYPVYLAAAPAPWPDGGPDECGGDADCYSALEENGPAASARLSSAPSEQDALVAFSVTFVNAAARGTSFLPAQKRVLRAAAQCLGEALLLQEQLGGFVSRQVAHLLQLQLPRTASGRPDVPASLSIGDDSLNEMTSLLARIDVDLRLRGSAHAELPGGVPMSLSILPTASASAGRTAASLAASDEEIPLRPYHSLLLLEDAAEIARRLPEDASPQLLEVVRRATPTRSIHELQAESGLPASQLLRLAGHLVHHGFAAIVDTISEESRYALVPGAVPTAADSAEFVRVVTGAQIAAPLQAQGAKPAAPMEEALVPSDLALNLLSELPVHLRSLGALLATLSRATANGLTLRALLAELPSSPWQRFVFVQAIAWLLKRRFLRHQHTHVMLLWPWAARAAETIARRREANQVVSAAAYSSDVDDEGGGDGAPVLDDASGLPWTAAELAHATALTQGHPASVKALFRRLLVYLRAVCVSEALRCAGDNIDGARRGEAAGLQAAARIRMEEVMVKLRATREELQVVLREFGGVFAIVVN
jgi:hypothetical protein